MLLAGVLLSLPLLALIYRAPAPQGPVSIQRLCGQAGPVERHLVARAHLDRGNLIEASQSKPTDR